MWGRVAASTVRPTRPTTGRSHEDRGDRRQGSTAVASKERSRSQLRLIERTARVQPLKRRRCRVDRGHGGTSSWWEAQGTPRRGPGLRGQWATRLPDVVIPGHLAGVVRCACASPFRAWTISHRDLAPAEGLAPDPFRRTRRIRSIALRDRCRGACGCPHGSLTDCGPEARNPSSGRARPHSSPSSLRRLRASMRFRAPSLLRALCT
jgi:hypothetical protein